MLDSEQLVTSTAKSNIRDATVTESISHRQFDMPEHDKKMAVLETKISTMSDDISHIRATVDSLVKTLSQLPVMEEKSRGQSEAIGRAFAEIDELREDLETLDTARQVERERITAARANELAAPALDVECQRRIEKRWPLYAQQNAIDGVYGEESLADMRQLRDSHRAAYHALLERDDLFSIEVAADDWWPAD